MNHFAIYKKLIQHGKSAILQLKKKKRKWVYRDVFEALISVNGCIPGSGIADTYGNPIFNFLRNRYTIFLSVCTILQLQQNSQRLQFLHILAN